MTKNSCKAVFLLILVLVFCCLSGCNTKSDVSSFLHMNFFYYKIGNRLFRNKVTVAMGNSLVDKNNNRILFIDDDYYQGITNICVSVFVDDETTPIEKIVIPSDEFFSGKYAVNLGRCENRIRFYNQTFEFIVTDYQINEFVKFEISYNWYYKENDFSQSHALYLYGNVTNNKFFLSAINMRWLNVESK